MTQNRGAIDAVDTLGSTLANMNSRLGALEVVAHTPCTCANCITVCTSTTRPSSPFDGQTIYETDTDNYMTWNGSAWVGLQSSTLRSPSQPYAQLRGAGGNWFQPTGGPLAFNTPAGFQWGVVHNVGGHFNTTTGAFIAPVTGVYLCSFQTYQQTYNYTSWIHWMWVVGGSLSWNGGNTPYNIFGYSDSAYADGAGTTMMIYVTAGNAIQIAGLMGGDERFYSDYTYLSVRLLG